VDLSVSYLSGGGAADLPVKLRTELQPLSINFPNYEEYVFPNGRIKPGIQKAEAYEDEYYEEEEGEREPGPTEKKGTIQAISLNLDKQGGARTRLAGLPETDTPQNILAELEFRDPNGEIQTVTSRIPRYPSQRLVGLAFGIKRAFGQGPSISGGGPGPERPTHSPGGSENPSFSAKNLFPPKAAHRRIFMPMRI